jgi:hypothetical protein
VSKIQVKFVKEVEVDLNAYYESFPRPLRTQIDDALFHLLGGTRQRREKVEKPSRSIAGASSFRLTGKSSRIGSKTAAIMADLRRLNGGSTVTREEILKVAKEHNVKVNNVVSNLAAHGHLQAVN